MSWTPRPYQLDVVKFILASATPAVLARIGSGKTSAALYCAKYMKVRAGWKALVVAPKEVARSVWRQENEKWGFGLKMVLLHGPKKNELLKQDADVYVVNYDGLAWLATRGLPRFEVLFLDESSKCRNTDTKRFKLLRDTVVPRAKRVACFTGTPKPNGEMNLFGQYRLLDGGERLGKYITHFRNQYCYQTGFGGYEWVLLPGADKLIQEKVRDITITVGDADMAGQLPELVVTDVEVALPDDVMRSYAKLERDYFVEIEGGVTAVNAAAKIAKLRQIASGSVYTDDGLLDNPTPRTQASWANVHDERLDQLDNDLGEASGPVLLFANFKHEFEKIKARFPHAVIFGDLSDRKRSEAIEAWNRNEIDLLCAHPASAGHGLNLQGGGASDLIWFSLLYDLELYEQSIGRLVRQGNSSKTVFVRRYIAPDTVDVDMARALAGKARGQNAFLEAFKARRSSS